MAKLISQKPVMKGSGSMKNTPIGFAVGSGSRPTPSRHKIETTQPSNQKTLGRSVPGAMK